MIVASCSRQVLAALGDDVRADLRESPATAIELHFELTVRPSDALEERGAGGWCDGVSIIDGGIILYRPTESRRENFTLLHELGHHLLDQDIKALTWIADEPDPSRVIEQVCDQIAADLLIPSEIVEQHGPDARGVLDLYDRTQASRSACAVAIARRLPCDGFIILMEVGAETVFFAARARDTRPYAWRGDSIPAGHPLRQCPPPSRTSAWWPQPTGTERRPFFMSTASDHGWTVAVFAENNLFGVPGFFLQPELVDDRGFDGALTCRCGYSGKTRWWPCSRCHKPECPECGECDCPSQDRRRVRCESCFVMVLPHLIEDGLCDNCR